MTPVVDLDSMRIDTISPYSPNTSEKIKMSTMAVYNLGC